LVSIRLLQAITPHFTQQYLTRFGFQQKHHPAYLTMALGAGSVTPLQMAEAYAVFANTGFYVPSYYIDKITDSRGRLIAQTRPFIAGQNAKRTLDPRNAYIMNSMLHDAASRGTGAKSNVLGRHDLAGKTGTTNESKDTWFAGFQPSLVAVVWLGYDQPRSLGSNETGGGLALPIWIRYMTKALHNVPAMIYQAPSGIVQSQGEVYLAEHINSAVAISDEGDDSSIAAPSEQQPVDNLKELLF
jgi:penicillin-binding protein 1A